MFRPVSPRPGLLCVALLCAATAVVAAGEPAAPAYGWRDMFREYLALRTAGRDCLEHFPGFDPEMARLGEAFARRAYPGNPEIGRSNFRRMALKLELAHPSASRREAIFTPNKSPWSGYAGPVDESDGMAHFLFNTGTLPMPVLAHPVTGVVRRHDVRYARVKPVAQCAARVLRREVADMRVIEHDATARAALMARIRAAFDAENPDARMTDAEAACLEECLPYMA